MFFKMWSIMASTMTFSLVQFDDEDKVATIMLGAEVEDIAEGAELQKQIIGNNTIVESEDDEDVRWCKRCISLMRPGDGEPEYVLLIRVTR